MFYLQYLATCTSYFSILSPLWSRHFCSMVPTFQSLHHRRQTPALSANSLLCLCQNAVLLSTVSCEEIDENHRKASPGCMLNDQILPIKNTAGASLLQLQCAPDHCHEELQCLFTTFLFACSELPFVDIQESCCMRQLGRLYHVSWIPARELIFWSKDIGAI